MASFDLAAVKAYIQNDFCNVVSSIGSIIQKLEAMDFNEAMKISDLESGWKIGTAVKKQTHFVVNFDDSDLSDVVLPFNDEIN